MPIKDQETSKVEFPISPAYCQGWTVRDAIREVIANAKDESGWYSIWYNQSEGRGYVRDKSSGIAKEHLVLGGGRNKGAGEIGQFKEGLKVAALVMARENRDFLIKTVDFSLRSSIGHSTEFNTDVMVFHFNGHRADYGTEVSFLCSELELRETQELFRKGKARENAIITDPDEQGKLYINGVYVQTIDSMFGYDIVDKEAANRDRTVLDMNAVHEAIKEVWECSVRNFDVIRRYLKSTEMFTEHHIYFGSAGQNRSRAWRRVLKSLYGPKYCVGTGDAHIAEDKGYRVIPTVSDAQMHSILRAGVQSSRDVARSRRGRSRPKSVVLSQFQKRMLEQAKTLAENILEVETSIVVWTRLGDDAEHDLTIRGRYLGLTPAGKYKLAIDPRLFTESIGQLTGTIVHEIVHGTSRSTDLTRVFERHLTKALGEFADVVFAQNRLLIAAQKKGE